MLNLSSIFTSGITIGNYLLCLFFALLCGIICAAASYYRSNTSKSFLICLAILPLAVATVIILVNGNIGTGIAVAGAFSLIRFRSVAGKAKDIVSVFLSMAAGLSCGAGYVTVALLLAVISAVLMIAFSSIPLPQDAEKTLRITVPENMAYSDNFDDIFTSFTASAKLMKTKTTAMGSLFKLTYRVKLKPQADEKRFIDAIRTKNGNLEVSLSIAEEGEDL